MNCFNFIKVALLIIQSHQCSGSRFCFCCFKLFLVEHRFSKTQEPFLSVLHSSAVGPLKCPAATDANERCDTKR